MIKIVYGDLLKAKEDIIAHQVNCQGKMNSGVAKQIRAKYPIVFKSYIGVFNKYGKDNLLGRTQFVGIGKGRFIANLFGQYDYGYDGEQYTKTDKLFKCFKKVRELAENNKKSVAMPYMIGCDRGGADWKEVEELLLKAFDGYEVTLYKLT